MDYVKGNSMGTQVWPLETINESVLQIFWLGLQNYSTESN